MIYNRSTALERSVMNMFTGINLTFNSDVDKDT